MGVTKVRGMGLKLPSHRHTVASLMLNHGIPVIVVSKILGHARPNITMDIYGHLSNEMQDEAVRLMDDLVTPIALTPSPLPKLGEGMGLGDGVRAICTQLHPKHESLLIEQAQTPDVGGKAVKSPPPVAPPARFELTTV